MKVTVDIEDDKLRTHIRECHQKAIELGACDTKAISTEAISIEDQIVEMCKPPSCEGYGASANCPPHVMRPTEARVWIQGFHAAVVFKIDVAPELLLSNERFDSFREVYMISSGLEAFSQERGYLLSRGLAAGSCRPVFCSNILCAALTDEGQCRYPSLARPSMEALGINVFQLAKDLGWEIHPLLRDSDPKDAPTAMLAGLVLVS